MKKKQKWKPGGRPRQRADTVRLLEKRRKAAGGDEPTALEVEQPALVPRKRKKEA